MEVLKEEEEVLEEEEGVGLMEEVCWLGREG